MGRNRLLWVALGLMAFMACGSPGSDGPIPSQEVDAAAMDQQQRDRRSGRELDFDDVMCLLDKRFEGFAGVEKVGRNLVMSFAADPPKELNKVKLALRRRHIAVSGRPVVRRVRYGFCKLQRWYDPLTYEALALEGVVMSDIDESRNDLFIGVSDVDRWEPKVRAIADDLGVPQHVLRVGHSEPASY